MKKIITGNWHKRWSPKAEAEERIYRVEEFLANNGYTLAQNSPVRVRTDRVILDDEVLQSTGDKNIWNIVEERIRKNYSSRLVSNLHGLVHEMLNIRPHNRKSFSSLDDYEPGEITVCYNTNKGEFNFVELAVKTPDPFSSMHLNLDYTDRKQLLFDWGHTNRLIVEVCTGDDDFAKEIVKIAQKK